MMFSLFLLSTVMAIILEPTSAEVYKHSVLLFEKAEHAAGVPYSLDDEEIAYPSNYGLYRRLITPEQSKFISLCTKRRTEILERNDQSLSFESFADAYRRCLENAIGIDVTNTEQSGLHRRKRRAQQADVNFGTNFAHEYKTKVTSLIQKLNFTLGYQYNQIPRVQKLEKDPKQLDVKEPGPENRKCFPNSGVGLIKTKPKTQILQQKDVTLTSGNKQKSKLEGSLKAAFKWLGLDFGLSLGGSRDQSWDQTDTNLTSEMRSTEFTVNLEIPTNKALVITDVTVRTPVTSEIYAPFEAIGWLTDVKGLYHETYGPALWQAIMFPVGDMAYYFPKYMTRVDANTMAFVGPPYKARGFQNERLYQVEELDVNDALNRKECQA